MSVSNAYEKTLLAKLKTDWPEPWVKLYIGNPGEEGTENAAAETTRKKIKLTGEQPLKNEAEVKWESVSTGETYKYVGLWSAEAAGTFLWYGALTAEKTVSAGDNAALKANELEINID